MNIVNKLPIEIKDIIKPYVIGYKNTIITSNNHKLELWLGPQEYQTGTFSKWNSKGQIKSKFNYYNGLKHGIQQEWYFNGNLHYIHYYHMGKRHGLSKGWYYDGQLWYHKYYNNGLLNNICKKWFSNGILEYQYCYNNGTMIYAKNSSISAKNKPYSYKEIN